MYSMSHPKPGTSALEFVSSSQERIVVNAEGGAPRTKSLTESVDSVRDDLRDRSNIGAINKTVEFEFRESIQ